MREGNRKGGEGCKAKGDDIFAILKAFGMELKAQLYTRGEIREMKATASPF